MQADARDVAVDEAGDAYIVGTIASDVLPSTSGAFQPRYNNAVCTAAGAPGSGSLPRVPCLDVFILKLTRDGQIAYATYFGGSGLDEVHAVIVDRAGAAIIGGLTRSVDLPTARAVQPECKSGFAPLACGDAFIAKLDPTGSSLVFATYLGGTDTEIINSLAVDDAGLVYAAGSITGSGLPVYRAPQSASGGGETDGFVAAFAPQGNLLWATYVGGKESESIVGVGAAAGFVYFGGETTSSSWAIGGAPFHGGRDLFSARVLDPGGR
jgi:hypothetical protein